MKRLILVMLTGLALAACNSNDDSPVTKTATPPVVQTDSFTAQVQDEVKNSSDDAEPNDIDSIALKTADDAEPVTVN